MKTPPPSGVGWNRVSNARPSRRRRVSLQGTCARNRATRSSTWDLTSPSPKSPRSARSCMNILERDQALEHRSRQFENAPRKLVAGQKLEIWTENRDSLADIVQCGLEKRRLLLDFTLTIPEVGDVNHAGPDQADVRRKPDKRRAGHALFPEGRRIRRSNVTSSPARARRAFSKKVSAAGRPSGCSGAKKPCGPCSRISAREAPNRRSAALLTAINRFWSRS